MEMKGTEKKDESRIWQEKLDSCVYIQRIDNNNNNHLYGNIICNIRSY